MRGTELKQHQIDAAEKFVRGQQRGGEAPESDEQEVVLPWGNLIRIVAWYGMIRARAVANGAPPDEPGEVVVTNHQQA